MINLNVSNVNFINEEIVEIKYKHISKNVCLSKNTNVAIGAFTTANARIMLYELMEKVGFDNVLYCGTDSVIYKHTKQYNPVKVSGSILGGVTDELEDPNDYITELIATAPKSYCYKTMKGKQCIKSKGFRLDGLTKQKLNFAGMKRMVMNALENESFNGEKIMLSII